MDERENKPQRGGGRPRGELHVALLQAVGELATHERGATMREAAARASMGVAAARSTMRNMVRAGTVVIARTRRVPYRNRPVAEYALPCAAPGANGGARCSATASALDALGAAWLGGPAR
jgi:hypothetical protein